MSDRDLAGVNPRVSVTVDGEALDIEYRRIDGPASAPLMIFLHEGLGSVAMWKDFPDRLCTALGFRGLVYSRPGYGTSTPRPHAVHWQPDFMHRQAERLLPALLVALDIDAAVERPWLFGHSDGGSIALIHAAGFPSQVAGLVVLAPHLDVEAGGLRSIAVARDAYLGTDLRERLKRHHADVDSAFWGWNDVWLSPTFRDWNIRPLLSRITCPVLAIQGRDDAYGSMAHIDGIADVLHDTVLVKLDDCGHSPHRDRTTDVIDATVHFVGAQGRTGRGASRPSRRQDKTCTTNS